MEYYQSQHHVYYWKQLNRVAELQASVRYAHCQARFAGATTKS